jgi:hypothetical protein
VGVQDPSVTPSGWLKRYFGTARPATPDDVADTLWNASVTPADFGPATEKYLAVVFEQYKLYVEMADRISARRALANTFFLTLNSAVLTLVGVFWKDRPDAPAGLLLVPLMVLVGLCAAWFWLVRSYRQLNSGKYAVIGALEQKLPASPYWSAEWKALGEGRDKARYWPLTHLEQWVPGLFAAAYLFGAIAALAA